MTRPSTGKQVLFAIPFWRSGVRLVAAARV